MLKNKPFFITFEGVEGSGKSYQCHKLYKKLKKLNFPVILTREPGGTRNAEIIRKVILEDYFASDSKEKFSKYTDTLLYLAARNEHVQNVIKPELSKKKIVICDRFTDSTLAYQVYGKGVNKNLIDTVHKHVLGKLRPNLTFVLKVNISRALKRLNKRKKKNRYDKFSKSFYSKVQNAFIKIAKKNIKRSFIVNNSANTNEAENIIFNKFMKSIRK